MVSAAILIVMHATQQRRIGLMTGRGYESSLVRSADAVRDQGSYGRCGAAIVTCLVVCVVADRGATRLSASGHTYSSPPGGWRERPPAPSPRPSGASRASGDCAGRFPVLFVAMVRAPAYYPPMPMPTGRRDRHTGRGAIGRHQH